MKYRKSEGNEYFEVNKNKIWWKQTLLSECPLFRFLRQRNLCKCNERSASIGICSLRLYISGLISTMFLVSVVHIIKTFYIMSFKLVLYIGFKAFPSTHYYCTAQWSNFLRFLCTILQTFYKKIQNISLVSKTELKKITTQILEFFLRLSLFAVINVTPNRFLLR